MNPAKAWRLLPAGIGLLFFWLFVGGSGYHFLMAMIGPVVPAKLEELGADNALIGLLAGSLPSLLAGVVNPFSSYYSDRTRSRYGRRIPYIFICAILMTAFLLLMAWAAALGKSLSELFGISTPRQVALVLFAGGSLLYGTANVIGGSIMYYLFPDVVPEKWLGRFMALFAMLGAAMGFVFSKFFLKYAEHQLPLLFTLVAVANLLLTLTMCFAVKEKAYPPPEPRGSVLEDIRAYFRECFKAPLYWFFFIGNGLNGASMMCRWLFNLLFAQKNLDMSYAQYGNITGWSLLLAFVLAYPIGMLVDKLHPLRVYMVGIVLIIVTNLFGFFLIKDTGAFWIFSLLIAAVYAIQNTSDLPLTAAIFPRDKYGQYCSASAMVRSLTLAGAGYLGGLFIDLTGDYRYLFIWDAFFTGLALIAMVIVYVKWRKLGGAASYRAP